MFAILAIFCYFAIGFMFLMQKLEVIIYDIAIDAENSGDEGKYLTIFKWIMTWPIWFNNK